jgi:hypothetical protein
MLTQFVSGFLLIVGALTPLAALVVARTSPRWTKSFRSWQL